MPNHSSLTRIRDRLGIEVFKLFFERILHQCAQHGLIKGKRLMTDGTLIEANASLDSLLKRTPEESLSPIPVKDNANKLLPTISRKISNKTHSSFSDPDATLAFKRGKSQSLKYKAHISIDADSRVILSIPVTTGACHESQIYLDNIEEIRKDLSLNIHEVIADRGYGGGEIIQSVMDKGIIPYIPLYTKKTGKLLENHVKGFLFDKKLDQYQCPKGVYLHPYSKISPDGRIMYRTKSKDCHNCQIKSKCPAEKMPHSHMRYVRRNIHQDLFEKTIHRMKASIFAQRLIERFWKIEGIISELKNQHGLRRAKYRGLIKMQIQAYLSAGIMNIKKLVKSLLNLLFCLWYEEKFI